MKTKVITMEDSYDELVEIYGIENMNNIIGKELFVKECGIWGTSNIMAEIHKIFK